MRVFVTGGTGFVGRAVVALLLRHGHDVEVLVRERSVLRVPYRRRLRIVEGDLLEPGAWQGRARIADAVVHLANAELKEWSRGAPADALQQGTVNLLEAVMHSNRVPPRFICLSHLGSGTAAKSPLLRLAAEKEAMVRQSGCDYVLFLSAPIFGPGDRFVSAWARWLRWVPVMPVIASAADITLQPIALRNVAEGIVKAVKKRTLIRREYHLAGPRLYTLSELLQAVGSTVRRSQVRSWPIAPAWYRRWSRLLAGLSCFPVSEHVWEAWAELQPCNPIAFYRDFCIRPIQLTPNLSGSASGRSHQAAETN